LKTSFWSPV